MGVPLLPIPIATIAVRKRDDLHLHYICLAFLSSFAKHQTSHT